VANFGHDLTALLVCWQLSHFLSPFVDSFKNFCQIAQKDSTWRMVDCNLKTYWKLLVDILQLIQH